MDIYQATSGAFSAEIVRRNAKAILMRRLDTGSTYYVTPRELGRFYALSQRSQDGEPEQAREAKSK